METYIVNGSLSCFLLQTGFLLVLPHLVYVNKDCVHADQTFALKLLKRTLSGLFLHLKNSSKGDAYVLRGIVKE